MKPMKLRLNASDKTIHRAKHRARKRKTSASKPLVKNPEKESEIVWLMELRRTDPGLVRLYGIAKGVKLITKDKYFERS